MLSSPPPTRAAGKPERGGLGALLRDIQVTRDMPTRPTLMSAPQGGEVQVPLSSPASQKPSDSARPAMPALRVDTARI